MTLQSIPPPPCLCQHGAVNHYPDTRRCAWEWCACDQYRPDKHNYPTGILVTS